MLLLSEDQCEQALKTAVWADSSRTKSDGIRAGLNIGDGRIMSKYYTEQHTYRTQSTCHTVCTMRVDSSTVELADDTWNISMKLLNMKFDLQRGKL